MLLGAEGAELSATETAFRRRHNVLAYTASNVTRVPDQYFGNAIRFGPLETRWRTTYARAIPDDPVLDPLFLTFRLRARRPSPTTPLLTVLSPGDVAQWSLWAIPLNGPNTSSAGDYRLVVLGAGGKIQGQGARIRRDEWESISIVAVMTGTAGSDKLRVLSAGVPVIDLPACSISASGAAHWRHIEFSPRADNTGADYVDLAHIAIRDRTDAYPFDVTKRPWPHDTVVLAGHPYGDAVSEQEFREAVPHGWQGFNSMFGAVPGAQFTMVDDGFASLGAVDDDTTYLWSQPVQPFAGAGSGTWIFQANLPAGTSLLTVPGLPAGSRQQFRVAAYQGASQGSWSDIAEGTVPGGGGGAVSAIATFRVQAPRLGNGVIHGVRVELHTRLETAGVTAIQLFFVDEFGQFSFLDTDGFAVDWTDWRMVETLVTGNPLGRPWQHEEVAAGWFGVLVANGTANIRISRFAVEYVTSNPFPVVPKSGNGEPPSMVRPNWADPIQVASGHQTAITSSPNGLTEDRRSLLSAPILQLATSYTALDGDHWSRILSLLLRNGAAQSPFPNWPHYVRSYAPAGAGQFVVPVKPGRRLLAPGQRVAIVDYQSEGPRGGGTTHYARAFFLYHNYILIDTALPQALPQGSYVVPLIDCDVALEQQSSAITAKMAQTRILATEAPGESQTPDVWSPSQGDAMRGVIGVYASGWPFSSEEFAPVFDWQSNAGGAVEVRWQREGDATRVGKGIFPSLKGERSRFRAQASLTFIDRRAWWTFRKQMAICKGRSRHLWVVDPQSPFEFRSIDANGIEVQTEVDFNDAQRYVEHIGIRHVTRDKFGRTTGRALTIRRRSTVTTTSGGLRFDFASEGYSNPRAEDIVAVHAVFRARNFMDSLTESWSTTERVVVGLDLAEVESDEMPLALLNNQVSSAPGSTPQQIPGLFFWFSAASNVMQLDNSDGQIKACHPYPHPISRAHFVLDASAEPGARLPSDSILPKHLIGAIPTQPAYPWVGIATQNWHNNQARVLVGGPYLYSQHAARWREFSTAEDKRLWDPGEGMTWVLVHHDGDALHASPQGIARVSDDQDQPIIEWHATMGSSGGNALPGRVRLYGSPGGSFIDANLPALDRTRGPVMSVVRWRPNDAGQSMGTVGGQPNVVPFNQPLASISEPAGGAYNSEFWLQFFDWPVTPSFSYVDTIFDTAPRSALYSLLLFKRALSNAELNQLADYFKSVVPEMAWENMP